MNTILLIFLALPLATIIISIALQKVLKSPILVSAIIFVVFLIIALVFNNFIFLVATIFYGMLSFLSAYIVCILCRISCRRTCNNNCNEMENEVITINSTLPSNNNGCNSNCCCQANNQTTTPNNGVSARIENTGCLCGSYRRRR